jgi:hypothetical protein
MVLSGSLFSYGLYISSCLAFQSFKLKVKPSLGDWPTVCPQISFLKFHSKEFHNWNSFTTYCDDYQIKRIRWVIGLYVACMGDMRNAFWIVVRNPKGKGSLGRPRRRWRYENIKMNLKEIRCKIVHLHYLALNKALVSAIINSVFFKIWRISWLVERLLTSEK